MKTIDIVKMANGWYVTRRYCGMNKGAEFFSIVPKDLDMTKSQRVIRKAKEMAYKAAEEAKNAYVTAWVGE